MSFSLIICDGIHPPQWTNDFLGSLHNEIIEIKEDNYLVFPSQHPSYNGQSIYQFILDHHPYPSSSDGLIMIGFSAGVVGALIASGLWQRNGGKVLALIAIDGWGVPLIANFPIHTISHDYFTHLTLIKFNHNCDSFYADPCVSHEQIWRSPLQTLGWWQRADGTKKRSNAIVLIKDCLEKYKQM